MYEHVCSTVSMILPHAEVMCALKCVCAFKYNMYVCMYICMCVYIPIYMYVCTSCMCVHLYVRT